MILLASLDYTIIIGTILIWGQQSQSYSLPIFPTFEMSGNLFSSTIDYFSSLTLCTFARLHSLTAQNPVFESPESLKLSGSDPRDNANSSDDCKVPSGEESRCLCMGVT